MKHIKWMPVLMALTILGIAAFQVYWLKQAYQREDRTLEVRSNMAFRETIFSLQAAKLKLDKIEGDSLVRFERGGGKELKMRVRADEKMVRMINVLRDKVGDTNRTILFTAEGRDSLIGGKGKQLMKRNRIMQFLYDMDDLQDSIRVHEIDAALTRRMQQQNTEVPFTINRLNKGRDEEKRVFNEVTIGFKTPVTYQLALGNITPYLMKRILGPVVLSFFLIAFTIVSFSLLYRNLLRQRRLADIKNEFISNITHELKTPIATVSVAIEALRTFNASIDPQKTKEYLDISANELQRLSLLVDKVLKLSMFEKREVELKYEPLDMKALVDEVTTSMRLQFEKHKALVKIDTSGDTTLQGDRLHLVSVIFNLLDNALKYSNGVPQIELKVWGTAHKLHLSITDSGIGIPAEYKDRVFEKFFRVPTGNVHNQKGYGLGLSYVAHVVQKHKGTIHVDGTESGGSSFVIELPKDGNAL
jgi:two-component system phosphate regulon sensor histidine kinase PhoR